MTPLLPLLLQVLPLLLPVWDLASFLEADVIHGLDILLEYLSVTSVPRRIICLRLQIIQRGLSCCHIRFSSSDLCSALRTL
ncbi:hypothetical protein E2C01_032667 [Portunus trituberculatus]|uniref:Secreted protein n=1 Tax=Portunus trituberculatus TaxID=210409 RepID=A0A5B7F078_PORTR|nr:hypothetical protein [Portunus trituberculatus]